MYKVEGQEKLAAKYCEQTFADVVFFTNSGTEAIEMALKIARKYQSANGARPRRLRLSIHRLVPRPLLWRDQRLGNPSYLEGFGPPLPGYVHCQFGDWEKLKELVGPNTAAILIERCRAKAACRSCRMKR